MEMKIDGSVVRAKTLCSIGPDVYISNNYNPGEGVHTVTITSVDQAGNSSVYSKNFIVDTVPPALEVKQSELDGTITAEKGDLYHVSFTLNDSGSTITNNEGYFRMTLENKNDGRRYYSGSLIEKEKFGIPQTNLWSFYDPFQRIEDGEYRVMMAAADLAGNVGPVRETSLIVDRKAPVIYQAYTMPFIMQSSNGTANLYYKLSEDDDYPLNRGKVDVKITILDKYANEAVAVFSNCMNQADGSENSFNWDGKTNGVELPCGTYDFIIEADDIHGNRATRYAELVKGGIKPLITSPKGYDDSGNVISTNISGNVGITGIAKDPVWDNKQNFMNYAVYIKPGNQTMPDGLDHSVLTGEGWSDGDGALWVPELNRKAGETANISFRSVEENSLLGYLETAKLTNGDYTLLLVAREEPMSVLLASTSAPSLQELKGAQWADLSFIKITNAIEIPTDDSVSTVILQEVGVDKMNFIADGKNSVKLDYKLTLQNVSSADVNFGVYDQNSNNVCNSKKYNLNGKPYIQPTPDVTEGFNVYQDEAGWHIVMTNPGSSDMRFGGRVRAEEGIGGLKDNAISTRDHGITYRTENEFSFSYTVASDDSVKEAATSQYNIVTNKGTVITNTHKGQREIIFNTDADEVWFELLVNDQADPNFIYYDNGKHPVLESIFGDDNPYSASVGSLSNNIGFRLENARPAPSFTWDGKDIYGSLVNDGNYRLVLTAEGRDGKGFDKKNIDNLEVYSRIDITNIGLSSTNFDPFSTGINCTTLSFRVTKSAFVDITVMDTNNRDVCEIVKNTSVNGNYYNQVNYNGVKDSIGSPEFLDKGNYNFRIVAWDADHPDIAATNFIPFTLNPEEISGGLSPLLNVEGQSTNNENVVAVNGDARFKWVLKNVTGAYLPPLKVTYRLNARGSQAVVGYPFVPFVTEAYRWFDSAYVKVEGKYDFTRREVKKSFWGSVSTANDRKDTGSAGIEKVMGPGEHIHFSADNKIDNGDNGDWFDHRIGSVGCWPSGMYGLDDITVNGKNVHKTASGEDFRVENTDVGEWGDVGGYKYSHLVGNFDFTFDPNRRGNTMMNNVLNRFSQWASENKYYYGNQEDQNNKILKDSDETETNNVGPIYDSYTHFDISGSVIEEDGARHYYNWRIQGKNGYISHYVSMANDFDANVSKGKALCYEYDENANFNGFVPRNHVNFRFEGDNLEANKAYNVYFTQIPNTHTYIAHTDIDDKNDIVIDFPATLNQVANWNQSHNFNTNGDGCYDKYFASLHNAFLDPNNSQINYGGYGASYITASDVIELDNSKGDYSFNKTGLFANFNLNTSGPEGNIRNINLNNLGIAVDKVEPLDPEYAANQDYNKANSLMFTSSVDAGGSINCTGRTFSGLWYMSSDERLSPTGHTLVSGTNVICGKEFDGKAIRLNFKDSYPKQDSTGNDGLFWVTNGIVINNPWLIVDKDSVKADNIEFYYLNGEKNEDLCVSNVTIESGTNFANGYFLAALKPGREGQKVVEIRGSVNSAYELLYYDGNNFQSITNVPVVKVISNATLAYWNVRGLSGRYTILLKAYNNQGVKYAKQVVDIGEYKKPNTGSGNFLTSTPYKRVELVIPASVPDNTLVNVTPMGLDELKESEIGTKLPDISPIGPILKMEPSPYQFGDNPADWPRITVKYTWEEANQFGMINSSPAIYTISENGIEALNTTVLYLSWDTSSVDSSIQTNTQRPEKFNIIQLTASASHFSYFFVLNGTNFNLPAPQIRRDLIRDLDILPADQTFLNDKNKESLYYTKQTNISIAGIAAKGSGIPTNAVCFVSTDQRINSQSQGRSIGKSGILGDSGQQLTNCTADNNNTITTNIYPAGWFIFTNIILNEGTNYVAVKYDSENSPVDRIIVLQDSAGAKIDYFNASKYISPNGDGNKDLFTADYGLSKDSDVRFELYDRKGNTLYSETLSADSVDGIDSQTQVSNTITWDCMDNNGKVFPDGGYDYRFSTVDRIGNVNEGLVQSFIIDTVPPELKTDSDSCLVNQTGETKLHFTATKPVMINIEVYAADGSFVNGMNISDYKKDDEFALPSYDSTFNPLPDGEYTLRIHYEDEAGNKGLTKNIRIIIDRTAPAITEPVANPQKFIAGKIRTSFSFFTSEDGFADILLANNNGILGLILSNYSVYAGMNRIEWDGTLNNRPVYRGQYQALLSVSDKNGNRSAVKAGNIEAIVDNNEPGVVFLTLSTNRIGYTANKVGIIQMQYAVTDDITSIPDSSVRIIDKYGSEVAVLKPYQLELTNEVYWYGMDSNGQYVPDGTYYAKVEASDEAGNLMQSSQVQKILVDNISPALYKFNLLNSYISPQNPGGIQKAVFKMKAVDSDSINADISIRMYGMIVRNIFQGILSNNTEQTFEWDGRMDNGDFATDGSYELQITLEDPSGNVFSRKDKIIVDSVNPVSILLAKYDDPFSPNGDQMRDELPVITTVTDDISPVLFVRYEIFKQDGETIVRTIETNCVGFAAITNTWDGKDDTGRLVPDGIYRIQETCFDLAGNKSQPVSMECTVDTTPPVLPAAAAGNTIFSPGESTGFFDDVTVTNQTVTTETAFVTHNIEGDVFPYGYTAKGSGIYYRVTPADLTLTAYGKQTNYLVTNEWVTFNVKGLTSEYLFNGNANDTSGNGNHGSAYNAALTSDRFGNLNSAYDFNGINSFVQTPLNMGGLTGLTYSAWVKPTGSVSGTKQYTIISQYDGGTEYDVMKLFYNDNNDKKFQGQVCGGFYQGGTLVINPNVSDFNQWYFVVLAYDGTAPDYQRLKLYVNNSLVATSNGQSILKYNTQYKLRIGAKQDEVNFLFKGAIDDVRIFNRALSDSEISYLKDLSSYSHVMYGLTSTNAALLGKLSDIINIPPGDINNGNITISYTVDNSNKVTVKFYQGSQLPDNNILNGSSTATVNSSNPPNQWYVFAQVVNENNYSYVVKNITNRVQISTNLSALKPTIFDEDHYPSLFNSLNLKPVNGYFTGFDLSCAQNTIVFTATNTNSLGYLTGFTISNTYREDFTTSDINVENHGVSFSFSGDGNKEDIFKEYAYPASFDGTLIQMTNWSIDLYTYGTGSQHFSASNLYVSNITTSVSNNENGRKNGWFDVCAKSLGDIILHTYRSDEPTAAGDEYVDAWDGRNVNTGRIMPDGTYFSKVYTRDEAYNKNVKVTPLEIDDINPDIVISYPLSNSIVSDMIDILGTISDKHLSAYSITIANGGTSYPAADGINSTVSNSLLAQFDTLGLSGDSELIINAVDSVSNTNQVRIPFKVENNEDLIFKISKVENMIVSSAGSLAISFYHVANCSVNVKLDGTDVYNYVYSSQGTDLYTYQPVNLTNGDHTLEFTANCAGKTFTVKRAVSFTVDNILPSLTIANPGQNQIVRGMLDISGGIQDEHLTGYELYLKNDQTGIEERIAKGNNPIESGQIGAYDTYGVNTSAPLAPADGFELRLTAYDIAGNTNEKTLKFLVDNAKPFADIIAGNGRLSSLTAVSRIPVVIQDANIDGAQAGWIDQDGKFNLIQNISGLIPDYSGTVAWNCANLNGLYTMRLIAFDKAGNTNIIDQPFMVDNNPPEIRNIITGGIQNKLRVSADLSDNDSLAYYEIGINGSGRYQKYTGENLATNRFSIDFENDFTGLNDNGQYTLIIQAADIAGNTNTTNISIIVDREPPLTVITSPDNNGVCGGTFTLKGNILDNYPKSWNILLDGEIVQSGILNNNSNAVTADIDTTSGKVPDGEHTITLNAEDWAGNISSDYRKVIIDNIVPALSFRPDRNDAVLAGNIDFYVTINDQNPLKYRIYYTNGTEITITSNLMDSSFIDRYVCSFDTAKAMLNGTFEFILEASDKAGNINRTSLPLDIDNTPPAVQLNRIDGNNTFGTAFPGDLKVKGLMQIEFTVSDTHSINYTLSSDSEKAGGFIDKSGTTNIIINSDLLPEGTNTIRIQSLDAAGNTSIFTTNVIVDRTPPFIYVEAQPEIYSSTMENSLLWIKITNDEKIRVQKVEIEGTNYAGVYQTAVIASNGISDNAWDYYWDGKVGGVPLLQGDYRLKVTAIDSVSNGSISYSGVVKVRNDIYPPALAVKSISRTLSPGISRIFMEYNAVNDANDITNLVVSHLSIEGPGNGYQEMLCSTNTQGDITLSWDGKQKDGSYFSDGTYNARLSVCDFTGNITNYDFTITIDSMPPQINDVTLSAVKISQNSPSVNHSVISLNYSDNYRLDRSIYSIYDGNWMCSSETNRTDTNQLNQNYVYTADYDGMKILEFKLVDSASNTAIFTTNLLVDNTPPLVNQTFSGSQSLKFDFTVTNIAAYSSTNYNIYLGGTYFTNLPDLSGLDPGSISNLNFTVTTNIENIPAHTQTNLTKYSFFVSTNAGVSIYSDDPDLKGLYYSIVPRGTEPVLKDYTKGDVIPFYGYTNGFYTLYDAGVDDVDNWATNSMDIFIDGIAPVLKVVYTSNLIEPMNIMGEKYISPANRFNADIKEDSGIERIILSIRGISNNIFIETNFYTYYTNGNGISFSDLGIYSKGLYEIVFNAMDLVSNESAVTDYVNIPLPDTTPPVSWIALRGDFTTNGSMILANSNVTIVLDAKDDMGEYDGYVSGVDKIEYRIDNDEWITYTVPLKFIDDGLHDFSFRAIDKIGNNEDIHYYTVKINNSEPGITNFTSLVLNHTNIIYEWKDLNNVPAGNYEFSVSGQVQNISANHTILSNIKLTAGQALNITAKVRAWSDYGMPGNWMTITNTLDDLIEIVRPATNFYSQAIPFDVKFHSDERAKKKLDYLPLDSTKLSFVPEDWLGLYNDRNYNKRSELWEYIGETPHYGSTERLNDGIYLVKAEYKDGKGNFRQDSGIGLADSTKPVINFTIGNGKLTNNVFKTLTNSILLMSGEDPAVNGVSSGIRKVWYDIAKVDESHYRDVVNDAWRWRWHDFDYDVQDITGFRWDKDILDKDFVYSGFEKPVELKKGFYFIAAISEDNANNGYLYREEYGTNERFSGNFSKPYYLFIEVCDTTNDGGKIPPLAIVIDTNAPVISVTGIEDAHYYSNNAVITVKSTDAHLDSSRVVMDSAIIETNSFTVSAEGVHTLEVTASDTFMNTNSVLFTFTIDKTKPEIDVSGLSETNYTSSVEFGYLVSDVNLDKVDAQLNGQALGTNHYKISASGSYNLSVKAVDKAGNSSEYFKTFTVNTGGSDNIAPVVTLKGLKPDQYYSNDISLSISVWDENLLESATYASIDGKIYYLTSIPFSTNINLEGSHHLLIHAEDSYSNTTVIDRIFVIDRTAPVIGITGAEEGNFYNSDKTISVNILEDNPAGSSVYLNGITVPTGQFTVSGSGKQQILAIAWDKVNHTNTASLSFVIDKTKPVITVTGLDATVYSNAVQLGYTAADDNLSAITAALNNQVLSTNIYSITKAGNYTLTIDAQDKAGNEAVLTKNFIVIDSIPPEITISGLDNGKYYGNDVNLSIRVSDANLSGSTCCAVIDGKTNILNGTTFVTAVTQEGTHHLAVYAGDIFSNCSETEKEFIIDKTAPAIQIDGAVNNKYYNTDVSVNMFAADANLSGSLIVIDQKTNGNGLCMVTNEGIHRIEAAAWDVVNHTNRVNLSFVIDKTKPVITVTGLEATVYSNTVQLGYTAADDNLSAITAALNNQVLSTNIYSVTKAGNYTLTIDAQDKAGNEAVLTKNFIVIDSIPPEITISGLDNGKYYGNDVNLSIRVSDANLSGSACCAVIDGKTNILNGTTFVTAVTQEGTHHLAVYAGDIFSNCSETEKEFIIDKTAPAIQIDGAINNKYYNTDVSVNMFAADANLSGSLIVIDQKTNGNGLCMVTNEGIHRIEAAAWDVVNHTNRVNLSFVIDKTKPVITVTGLDSEEFFKPVEFSYAVLDENISETEAFLNGMPLTANSVKITMAGSYIFSVRAVDKAGNETDVVKEFLLHDTTPPSISVSGLTEKKYYSNDIYLTVQIDDPNLSLSNTTVSIDGKLYGLMNGQATAIINTEGNHILNIYAEDIYTNIASVYREFVIDKKPPKINIINVIDKHNYLSVSPVVSVKDDFTVKPVFEEYLKKSDEKWILYTNWIITNSGNYQLLVYAEDEAGNHSTNQVAFNIVKDYEQTLLLYSGFEYYDCSYVPYGKDWKWEPNLTNEPYYIFSDHYLGITAHKDYSPGIIYGMATNELINPVKSSIEFMMQDNLPDNSMKPSARMTLFEIRSDTTSLFSIYLDPRYGISIGLGQTNYYLTNNDDGADDKDGKDHDDDHHQNWHRIRVNYDLSSSGNTPYIQFYIDDILKQTFFTRTNQSVYSDKNGKLYFGFSETDSFNPKEYFYLDELRIYEDVTGKRNDDDWEEGRE